MNRKDFDELKRLCEEAAPGPWRHDHTGEADEEWGNGVFEPDGNIICEGWADEYGIPDMQFIAASRTAIPELIKGVERLILYHKASHYDDEDRMYFQQKAYDNLPAWIKEMLG